MIPWTKANRSTSGPRRSNRLDTLRPDSPNGAKGNISGMAMAFFVRAGLCSNVSTWLTPPDMNKKMQRLAAGGKCGFFGESGLASAPGGAAGRASSASIDANASAPMPFSERRSTSRRGIKGRFSLSIASIDIHKLVQVEQHAAQSGQSVAGRLGREKFEGRVQLVFIRRPRQRQLIGFANLCGPIGAGRLRNPPRHVQRFFIHQIPIEQEQGLQRRRGNGPLFVGAAER